MNKTTLYLVNPCITLRFIEVTALQIALTERYATKQWDRFTKLGKQVYGHKL